ncbi:hypothetical protein [Cardinium endosymbiont of Bemisia tabaci]|nr:hypothetical protein [Cardinium endosymbiont of Bemisia tabaci]
MNVDKLVEIYYMVESRLYENKILIFLSYFLSPLQKHVSKNQF